MRVCGGGGEEGEEKGGMHWARGAETFAHLAGLRGRERERACSNTVQQLMLIESVKNIKKTK